MSTLGGGTKQGAKRRSFSCAEDCLLKGHGRGKKPQGLVKRGVPFLPFKAIKRSQKEDLASLAKVCLTRKKKRRGRGGDRKTRLRRGGGRAGCPGAMEKGGGKGGSG